MCALLRTLRRTRYVLNKVRAMDLQNLSSRFNKSKTAAEQMVRGALNILGSDIVDAVTTLETAAGQPPPVDVDEIVTRLYGVRDEWIRQMRIIFDSAIMSIKKDLSGRFTLNSDSGSDDGGGDD